MAKEEGKLSYVDRYDMAHVSLSEARDQVILHIKSGQTRGCPLFVGESGIGKTQVWQAIADACDMDLRMIHTAHYGLMGAGIPVPEEEKNFFNIALPSLFQVNGRPFILVFDEVNRGAKYVINMFFTLMEDRKMFDYVMPEDCMVAATMNPSTGQYAVTELENEVAFRRRMKWFYISPDFKGWLQHAETDAFHANSKSNAKGKPCHPGILSYFRAKPKSMYDYKAKDEGKLFCCPATIETLSEDVWNMEEAGISIHGEFAFNRLGSSTGMALAAEVIAHLKDSSVTLSADDVLSNFPKVKKAIKKMVKNSLHEQLMDLSLNVMKLLFATTPDIGKTATNFTEFCHTLPLELSSNMLFGMKKVAQENQAEAYMYDLLDDLQENDKWIALQTKIDKDYRSIDEGLKGEE
jgi:hypothetical protein